jgi:hypothetical protein
MPWRVVALCSFSVAYLFVALVIAFGRPSVEHGVSFAMRIKVAGTGAVSMSLPVDTGLVSTKDDAR